MLQYLIMRNMIVLRSTERRALRYGPRVLANSIPKSGTHLLRNVLKQLPNIVPRWIYHIDHQIPGFMLQINAIKGGQCVTAHLPWSPPLEKLLNRRNVKTFLMVRDLRDICVSAAYYGTYRDKSHRLYPYYRSLPSDNERLMASIAGIEGHQLPDGVRSKSWGEHAEGFLPWFNVHDCLVVRFEDLVGESGGGSKTRQLDTVKLIVNHLDMELSHAALEKIATNAFSINAKTYRKGQIGDWQNHFNSAHKQVFKKTAGKTLIAMGYTNDLDW
jgi:hypothetical protein